MLSSSDGRLKLALALLLPMAVIAGGLLLFPPGESTPGKTVRGDVPVSQPETTPQEKPAPPPPPVAVSEMPDTPPPRSLPESQETPAAEVAVIQPVPEPTTPVAEPKAGQVEMVSPVPKPGSEPVAAVTNPEHGLVEAIPVEPAPSPEPEKPAPLPSAPPEQVNATAPAELIHTVVRGDTLSGISSRYKVSPSIVRKANGMRGDNIMLGQKLMIPGGTAPAAEPEAPKIVEAPAPSPRAERSHTVVRGDTLERIARKYGVTPQQVMQANAMKSDVVRLGRKLVIPAP
jgi:LysM repeat protein